MRFKLLPLEPFWFRITAQATPQKIVFVFDAKFLHCSPLLVLDVLRSLKCLVSASFEQDLLFSCHSVLDTESSDLKILDTDFRRYDYCE